eukprot:7500271-Pyramimonas_sp.AAC.1
MTEPHAQESTRTPVEYIMNFAESIEQGSLYFGCVFSSKHGWMISKDGQRFPGPMRAAFTTAARHLQLVGCIGIRVGHG